MITTITTDLVEGDSDWASFSIFRFLKAGAVVKILFAVHLKKMKTMIADDDHKVSDGDVEDGRHLNDVEDGRYLDDC